MADDDLTRGASTPTLKSMADRVLAELANGAIEPAKQPFAAAVLYERIRRLENTTKAKEGA